MIWADCSHRWLGSEENTKQPILNPAGHSSFSFLRQSLCRCQPRSSRQVAMLNRVSPLSVLIFLFRGDAADYSRHPAPLSPLFLPQTAEPMPGMHHGLVVCACFLGFLFVFFTLKSPDEAQLNPSRVDNRVGCNCVIRAHDVDGAVGAVLHFVDSPQRPGEASPRSNHPRSIPLFLQALPLRRRHERSRPRRVEDQDNCSVSFIYAGKAEEEK